MLLNEEKIFNYLNGQATAKEVAEVEKWIADSDNNKSEFEKIKKIHELTLEDTSEQIIDVDRGWEKVSDHLFSAKEIQMNTDESSDGSNWNIVWRIAAMIVVSAGLAFFYFNQETEKGFELAYTTQADEIKSLTLADGSVVTLNGNSTFKYFKDLSDDSRKVHLEGEAFFEVAKDAERPFIITSRNATTQVLGTSFNLRSDEDGAFVDVFSGRVAFGDLTRQDGNVILTKGQRASFVERNTQIIKGFDQNIVSWKTRDLVFEATPISEVASSLEKLYHVDIDFDENIAGCLITSTFEDQTLEEILNVIKIIAQIDNTNNEDNIQLSGPGCQ